MSSATFAQLNKQVLITRGLKFRPGEPLHVKTHDALADEEVPTFSIKMVSDLNSVLSIERGEMKRFGFGFLLLGFFPDAFLMVWWGWKHGGSAFLFLFES